MLRVKPKIMKSQEWMLLNSVYVDVMHIENNFFNNVFNTVMDVKGKTKDNEKTIMDVVKFCLRGDLELVQLQNGKLAKPKANYTFTTKDAKEI